MIYKYKDGGLARPPLQVWRGWLISNDNFMDAYLLIHAFYSELISIIKEVTGLLLRNVLATPLTLKHRETHGCVVSTVATDALVLKHQAISIHNAN